MDVARAITNIVMDPQSAGRTYELTGLVPLSTDSVVAISLCI